MSTSNIHLRALQWMWIREEVFNEIQVLWDYEAYEQARDQKVLKLIISEKGRRENTIIPPGDWELLDTNPYQLKWVPDTEISEYF